MLMYCCLLFVIKSAKIATAALRGLARLDSERFIGEITECLLKGTPGISREAARSLSAHTSLIDRDLLWAEFKKNRTRITCKRIAQVLFSTTKWESLYYLLSTYAHEDTDITQLSQDGLRRWLQQFNRGFSQPTKAQQARLLQALAATSTVLPSPIAQQIKFFVDTSR